MQSIKQGGIKYHFFSLPYDSTLDWAPVFGTIGEHFNHYANGLYIYIYNVVHSSFQAFKIAVDS